MLSCSNLWLLRRRCAGILLVPSCNMPVVSHKPISVVEYCSLFPDLTSLNLRAHDIEPCVCLIFPSMLERNFRIFLIICQLACRFSPPFPYMCLCMLLTSQLLKHNLNEQTCSLSNKYSVCMSRIPQGIISDKENCACSLSCKFDKMLNKTCFFPRWFIWNQSYFLVHGGPMLFTSGPKP